MDLKVEKDFDNHRNVISQYQLPPLATIFISPLVETVCQAPEGDMSGSAMLQGGKGASNGGMQDVEDVWTCLNDI